MFNIIHGSEKNGHISRHGLEVDVRRGGIVQLQFCAQQALTASFLLLKSSSLDLVHVWGSLPSSGSLDDEV